MTGSAGVGEAGVSGVPGSAGVGEVGANVSTGAGIPGAAYGTAAPSATGDPEEIQEEIRVLQARLQEALKREEYEMAAKYRDKIRELKEGRVE
ncbi:MAG: UvrB/UvrC motif-containing protein [Eubacteriales bacterium]|nr:UvrB/UvrC motif-containing protein [Eubacteriales bacterium]